MDSNHNLGGSEEERYFFNLREAKYLNGKRFKRATMSGYWKATGRDKPIIASRCNQLVGWKKDLVFYRGKPPHASPTDWIMHEYRLAATETSASGFSQRKFSAHVSFPSSSSSSCSKIRKKTKQFVLEAIALDVSNNSLIAFLRHNAFGHAEFHGSHQRMGGVPDFSEEKSN